MNFARDSKACGQLTETGAECKSHANEEPLAKLNKTICENKLAKWSVSWRIWTRQFDANTTAVVTFLAAF
jgi:hypothetical protein